MTKDEGQRRGWTFYQAVTLVPLRYHKVGGKMSPKKIGSVMVVGGGIAGMQAALDLANSGYYVYLVERSSSIGGLMSQLDKTFPTNDCAM
jgi:heterodisulfide reductase subunit A-like polyferredoxin